MEENKSIFRKKSLERISSPEDLDSYLVVTGPGVWFPLLAVVVMLIATIVWMFLGRLDTTMDVAVVSENNCAVCYVPLEQLQKGIQNETVQVSGKSYTIRDDGRSPQIVTNDTDVNLRIAGSWTDGMTIKPMRVDGELESGVYTGKIVVETIKPISFIIN